MQSIVLDIREGNRKAFRELFEDYYPVLCCFVRKYVKDEEAYKDIVQEVFLTYWQHRQDFDNIHKVKCYLYTVARNRCINWLKRGALLDSGTSETPYEPRFDFEDEIFRQETFLLVRKAVDALPPQMCRIITLSMQGQKSAAIAQKLSIAENTVHALKRTAYQKLRESLREHFYLLLF